MKWFIRLFILIIITVGAGINYRDPEYHILLEEVEVKDYRYCSNIYKADSVLALVMLLNRECPTCSYEEKVYWASCTTYGVSIGRWTWQEFIFERGQFWGFTDKRIKFNPNNKRHQENLKAVIQAWENPKPVMFYASHIDDPLHYNQVKRNSVWKGHHYYSLHLN